MNIENSNSENELVNISKNLFSLIGLETSNSQIKEQLLKHPDYPNVNAITSLFSQFGIKSRIGRINLEQLNNLKPFSYNFSKESYVYEECARFKFGFYTQELSDKEIKNINGGTSSFNRFIVLIKRF